MTFAVRDMDAGRKAAERIEGCNEAQTVPQITGGLHGVLDYALDPETAHRLWDVSTELQEAAGPDAEPRGPRLCRR